MHFKYDRQYSFMQLMTVVNSATILIYGEDYKRGKYHYWTIRFKSAIDANDYLDYNSLLAGLINELLNIAERKPFDNSNELQLSRILGELQQHSTSGTLSNMFYDYRFIAIANYEHFMYTTDDDIDYKFDSNTTYVFNTAIDDVSASVEENDEEKDIADFEMEPELIDIPDIEEHVIQENEEPKKKDNLEVKPSTGKEPDIAWKRLIFFMSVIILFGWLALK